MPRSVFIYMLCGGFGVRILLILSGRAPLGRFYDVGSIGTMMNHDRQLSSWTVKSCIDRSGMLIVST